MAASFSLGRTKLRASTLLLVALASTSVAYAADKQQCIAAYEQAQAQRKQSHYSEARQQLQVCLHSDCPQALREECAKWFDEVEAAMPSVVVVVVAPNGDEIEGARLFVDGALIAERREGKAIAVDVGARVFRVEAPGYLAAEQRLILHEGEKLKAVRIALRVAPKTESVSQSQAGGEPRTGHRPIAPLVVAGVGLGVFAGGLIAWLHGNSIIADAEKTCPGHVDCSDTAAIDKGNTGRSWQLAGGLVGLSGIAAVGIGTIWYLFSKPGAPAQPQTTSLRLTPSATSLGFQLSGRF